jgi:flagellar motor switch protein FliN
MKNKQNNQSAMIHDYGVSWAKSLAEAAGRIDGTPVTFAELSSDESRAQFTADSASGLWLRFFAGKSGEQAFLMPESDAARLVQVLASASQDGENALTDESREVLQGFFQQLATTLPPPGRGEELEFSGYERPTWPAAALASFRLSSAKGPLCVFHQVMSDDFVSSAQPAAEPPAALRPTVAPPAPIQDSNLEILMDVDLEVTLRFGQKQMLLRDILNVGPGSVIELDQQVQDPVELVVGKRVVARGEVVAVDGNYGLRITSIASRRERLESLVR